MYVDFCAEVCYNKIKDIVKFQTRIHKKTKKER